MTKIAREFLGWTRPLLVAAADWLVEKYATRDELNLHFVEIIVPGKRAGRRLLELLVTTAENSRRRLTPPVIETVGEFPERHYLLQRPLASDLVQQLAWTTALRDLTPTQRQHITAIPPADDDSLSWWSLGSLLWKQHRELAADGRDFAAVQELGRNLSGFDEAARWEAMQQVRATALRTLDDLKLWDVQTARLVAIQKREFHTNRDLILVGAVDMNRTSRMILDQLADRVTALIAAPAEFAERFDSHGCLRPEAWERPAVELPLSHVRICDGPVEQAEQVARELTAFDGKYPAADIVVGLADARLGPFVERQLAACGVPTRWIEGSSIANSAPCRLLQALAEVLDRGRFDDFAGFVRHPDLPIALAHTLELAALDDAFNRHLPLGPDTLLSILERRGGGTSEPPNSQVGGDASQAESLSCEDLLLAVRDLIAPLRASARPLHEWASPLRSWLQRIYAAREFDDTSREGRITARALRQLNLAIQEIADVPPNLSPKTTAADAIRCVLKQTTSQFVPPPEVSEAIELLGWLELPLDDTPVAIVTSFNDGFVPTSLNSDLFLPNELRRQLGLNENARRFARDAYAVTLMQQSRRDVIWLIGRRDADGYPLAPSRLYFAVEPASLPERVLRFVEPADEHDRNSQAAEDFMAEISSTRPANRIEIPTPEQVAAAIGRPELLAPLRELTLNVTEFKSYLACPYRYFLGHVLKLKSQDDRAVEMDALAFGNLMHDVLKLFGRSDARDSTDEARIRQELIDQLNFVVQRRFGARRRAALNVQLKQLEARLESFARWQARWRADGWCIRHVEIDIWPDPGDAELATLRVDDVTAYLHGRMDRVDCHEQTGECVIFDYKSGDKGNTPEATHRKRAGAWIDLQLPLYRHLAQTLKLPNQPRVGYLNLPRDLGKVGPSFAEWSQADFEDADRVALEVVRGIARREFWPPTTPAPSPYDEFNDLCQVGVFDAS
jgi:inactivated superfamily I helicase